jgi:hypothetical protein
MPLAQKPRERLFRSLAPTAKPHRADTATTGLFWLLSGLIGVLSLATRLYQLGRPSVWFDEAASWTITTGSWKDFWRYTIGGEDCGGFLYALLLRFWTACFGQSEAALRVPGVLAAVAFTGVMLALARSLWGRAAGLYVGLLAALHPQVIAWSRQARAYSLELLAAALCLAALVAYSRSGRRRDGWLLAWAACLIVALHTFGTFVVAGMMLFLVGRRLLRSRREDSWVTPRLWPIFPALVLAVAWHLLLLPRIRSNLMVFWTEGTILDNYGLVLRAHLPLWPVYAGLLAAGLVLLVRARWEQHNGTILAILACLALPVLAGPVAASLLGKHHFIVARYFLPVVVLFVLPVGYLLSRLRPLFAVPAALALCAVVFTRYTLPEAYGETALDGSDARRTSAYLKHEMRETDRLVLCPGYEWLTLRYYGLTGPFLLVGDRQKLGSVITQAGRETPGGRTWVTLQASEENLQALGLPGARVQRYGNLNLLRVDNPVPSP